MAESSCDGQSCVLCHGRMAGWRAGKQASAYVVLLLLLSRSRVALGIVRSRYLQDGTIRCNAIDAAISMRKPSRAVRCRAELGADGLRRSDQFGGGGIGMRSTCKAAIRDGQRTNRVGCLGWFRCSLAFAFGGWQRSCSRREGGNWGEDLAESAENEPRDAAVGSALFFSLFPR